MGNENDTRSLYIEVKKRITIKTRKIRRGGEGEVSLMRGIKRNRSVFSPLIATNTSPFSRSSFHYF
jgi:hypothetical protein